MKDTLIRSRALQHTRAYFTSPDQATPRNLTTEMLQTISGFEQTAPRQLALNRAYGPQYGALNLDLNAQNLYGYDDAQGVHHPGSLEQGRTGATYQRTGDIADVANLGPAAFAALLQSNPLLAASLGNLSLRTQDSPLLGAINQQALTAGQSPILSALNQQAASGLASGGQLSPEEIRANRQQTAAGFAARGTYGGNQSLGAELLNRDAAQRARAQQSQQLATGVEGLNQNATAQRNNFLLGAQGANINQSDLVGRASQIFGSQFDPFLSVISRPGSGASGAGSGGTSLQQIGTGAKMFDPLNPYANDVYQQNFTAQQANNTADANAQNANTSAAISLASILLSDKRLKKDVRDTGKKTEDGIPVKTWKYKTDPKKRKFVGVMAQDVEKVRPDAVITEPFSGVKAVDYAKISAPFAEIREMLKEAA